MVTYIMDHPVYVPHPRLLSTSFHTFIVINTDWLITPKPIITDTRGASEGTRTSLFW